MEQSNDSPVTITPLSEPSTTATLNSEHQRLTPTGKISHAKTRVYTQRYRREWEQMPDFKGWLTSVPFQATRAFCTYCKKNLHAHRLSLLKHTCTMKHQRAAMAHRTNLEVKNSEKEKEPDEYNSLGFEHVELNVMKDSPGEEDDQEEAKSPDVTDFETEFVVESLETDDEADEASHEDYPAQSEISDGEKDLTPLKKKLKLEKVTDTLAEAMAHVGDGFMDDLEVQTSEVVVTEEEQPVQEQAETVAVSKNTRASTLAEKNLMYKIKGSETLVTKQGVVGTLTPITRKIVLPSSKSIILKPSSLPPGYVLSKMKSSLSTVATAKPAKQRLLMPKPMPAECVQAAPAVAPESREPVATPKAPKKNCISTYVVDTCKGLPVCGLQVSLYKLVDGRWTFLNESSTGSNGRCADLVDMKKSQLTAGRYKIHYDVDKYFTLRRIETMYPFIEIVFDVKNPIGNYHIPVLLSPFSYTTYRGGE